MRNSAWILAGALALTLATAMGADGDGSVAVANQPAWARWQSRLSLGVTSNPGPPGVQGLARRLGSASLMGDYYFSRWLSSPGQLGGFRATSGLIFGPRSMMSTGQPGRADSTGFSVASREFALTPMPYTGDSASDNATLPYLGLGYTGQSLRSGWGFSADLGLFARSAGSVVRLGRTVSGSQTLDDAIRELRMTPLLQLGVSYAF